MIKIEKVDVFGWESAVRGMRNPLNSWDKIDSDFGCGPSLKCNFCGLLECPSRYKKYAVGDNDLTLMKKLVKAGSDHSKFMRFITVTMDITAPLYWWKEFDTYKVGTVANSCSTMHKIHDKEFTMGDFSHEHLLSGSMFQLHRTVDLLNEAREEYLTTRDKIYWWQMIQLLPSSYNQKRTVQLNYAVLRNMYSAREAHKLNEWREFCKHVEELPYAKELICYG